MPLGWKKLISCPMHDVIVRSKARDNKSKCKDEVDDDDPQKFADEDDVFDATTLDDPDLALMRKTMERNPEQFVLNNLMMCVQFFRNFDEEIQQLRQTLVSSQEASLNANLPPQKRALLPDVLQEHVGRTLKFTSARQTLRPTVEPLQPIRVYVVHENIDVAEHNDSHHYTPVTHILTYNLHLKAADNKGYVYLEHLGAIPTKKKSSASTEEELSSIAENSDEYEKRVYELKKASSFSKSLSTRSLPDVRSTEQNFMKSQFYRSTTSLLTTLANQSPRSTTTSIKQFVEQTSNKAEVESPASSTSSGYATSGGIDSDSDYGYSARSSVTEMLKSAELPNSCFKMIPYTQSGKIYNPREERRQGLTRKQKRIKDELRRYNYNLWYLSNLAFMRHFFKLFKQHLAPCLNLDAGAVSDAKCLNSIIYCDKIDVLNSSSSYTKVEPYEIIPTIWTQWPNCASEWFVRDRKSWPNFELVQKVKEFGCYLVPENFIPKDISKQQSNRLRKIEWQMTFPAAERYLETCLDHAQTKVLLVAFMLHKSFVRPVDTLLGLTTSHIRNKLFWLVEESGAFNWPEHRTGECLIKLLSAIYQSISQNTPLMKDYFMKDKNLFQNIPNECLLQSQKQINRILTNPIMYLIHAMQNIHYKQDQFPRLDYDELLRILTLDIVSLVNPHLAQINRQIANKSERGNSVYDSRSGFWDESGRQIECSVSRKPVTNKTLINPKAIVKNPIIEISVRCAQLENNRLVILMDFFIRHFIQTAQRFHQYGVTTQKSVYVAQAERLCILLSELDDSHNIRSYMNKINFLKENRLTQAESPERPKRNSDAPFFSRPLKDRFVFDVQVEGHQNGDTLEDVCVSPESLQLRSPRKRIDCS